MPARQAAVACLDDRVAHLPRSAALRPRLARSRCLIRHAGGAKTGGDGTQHRAGVGYERHIDRRRDLGDLVLVDVQHDLAGVPPEARPVVCNLHRVEAAPDDNDQVRGLEREVGVSRGHRAGAAEVERMVGRQHVDTVAAAGEERHA